MDSLVTLICPACGQEMKKSYVSECDKVIDICSNGCGGIFFDNQELKYFDERHESIEDIEKLLKEKTFTDVDTTKTRICPVCNVPMVKNSTSALNKIQIDDCYTCGGKFLDYSELDKIRKEFSSEEASDAHFRDKNSMFKDVLKQQDNELKTLRANRSVLKKIFDTYIWKS